MQFGVRKNPRHSDNLDYDNDNDNDNDNGATNTQMDLFNLFLLDLSSYLESPVAIRIKSHWSHAGTGRALPEIAGALAFIAWRIALDKAINLHCERFVYRDDAQRLGVIGEYLAFLIQVADRLAYTRAPSVDGAADGVAPPAAGDAPPDRDGQRRALISALARKLIEHVQDNSQDLLGPGDYGSPFIALLNQRSAQYADFQLDADGPSYAFLRHLGYEVQGLMGPGQENRWVIDQVMDKDGWDAYRSFAKAFRDLFE